MNRETTIHGGSDVIVVDDQARRRRTVIIAAVVILAALAILIAFLVHRSSSAKEAAAAQSAASQLATVTVITPGRSMIGRTVVASGPLAAKRDQPVGVAGQGGRVVRVNVDAGSWVGAGQVLAVIDRSVQAEQAAQLAAQIDAARAQAALAQSNYDRALALKDRGFVSKAELDAKKSTRDAAYAQVRVAQAQLGATRAQIGQLNILAPTGGLILQRNVEVGQVVSPGTPALFRLAAGGQMEMQAQLSQQDLAAVRVGMPVKVTPVGADHSIDGSVWQVAPVIDPQSRLGSVRISVPYDSTIRPGGFAEARIVAGTTSAPLLPQSAVLSDADGNYVYIIDSKDVVVRRNIKIGEVDEQGVAIIGGLEGSERVVESAGAFLNPGQKVNPRRQAAR